MAWNVFQHRIFSCVLSLPLLFADVMVLLASSSRDLQLLLEQFTAKCDVKENQHL